MTNEIKGTLKPMMKPRCRGNNLTINLSQFGYKDYFVECLYYFNKKEEKYALSVYLCRNDLEDRMKLSCKHIDTQYISGTRETIVEYICRVIYQLANNIVNDNGEKYLDYFVDRYEYELACFERGNELFEQEQINQVNDDKK